MNDNLRSIRRLIQDFQRYSRQELNGVQRFLDRLARRSKLPFLVTRRRFARPRVTKVVGHLPTTARGLITIVSHELHAAGAPKVLAEIIGALRGENWAIAVVGPDDGPYARILAEAGALVVVSPDALDVLSPAVALSALSTAVICNTIACLRVVSELPADKVVWYLHETGAIELFRRQHAYLPSLIGRVKQVWVASPLVLDHIKEYRPDAEVVGASCSAITGGRAVAGNSGTKAIVLGSIEQRKGQDLLASAYGLLPEHLRRDLNIRFLGRQLEPDFSQAFREQIKDRPELRYEGSVSPSDAVRALLDADILIVPSRDEPLPLVALEALSAGRVVVCTKAAGISGYLTDGVSGFIGESPDPADLAVVLSRAMANRATWVDIGTAGRMIFESTFSPAVFREKILELLWPVIGVQDSEAVEDERLTSGDPDLLYAMTGREH